MAEKAQVAKKTQVIECKHCGRLHQVDVDQVKDSITCECGKELEVGGQGDGAAAVVAGVVAAASGVSILTSLRQHWKFLAITASVLVAAVVVLSFLYGPDIALGKLNLGQGGGGGGGGNVAKTDNAEVYLLALADNNRSDEHPDAAAMLARMKNPIIVPRLCQLAARKELSSRLLVVKVLGEKGDESALSVLGTMINEPERTVVLAVAEAVARINSPLSETILLEVVRMPSRAREVLPAIAVVRNDVSMRVMNLALDDPSLRSLAMEQIGAAAMNGCIPSLMNLARNRLVLEADCMMSMETLGRINTPEARRALLQLTQDGHIGWKARQVLETITSP